jgi:hypothetical protein
MSLAIENLETRTARYEMGEEVYQDRECSALNLSEEIEE